MMARPRKNIAASRASLLPESAPLPEIPVREQPYPLPEGWKWVRLGDVYTINPKNEINNSTLVSFVPMEKISPGMTGVFTFETRNWEKVKRGYTHFADGDVAFAKISPCFENRKSMIVHGLENGYGAGTTELIVLRQPNILQKYTFFIISTDDFIQKGVKTYSGTVGQQRISIDFVRNYPIPLPPREEQERIVGHIESLFARLDEARQKAEAVRDSVALRRAAILHKAFTGELTAKWREEHNKPYTWETKKLKEICQKITDGTHHSPENSEIGDYMYVTAKNIKESGIDLSKITYIDKKTHAEIYSRCDVKFEDVLYIKDGATTGIATVNTLHEEFSLLSSVAVLRPKINILFPYFLAYSLNSSEVKSKMINNMSGNAITRLTLSKIKESSIAICALEEQREIVRILDDLLGREQRLREAADAVVAHIERMKKAILARAFRGELGRADCPSRP